MRAALRRQRPQGRYDGAMSARGEDEDFDAATGLAERAVDRLP
jgi:hypothetical protein